MLKIEHRRLGYCLIVPALGFLFASFAAAVSNATNYEHHANVAGWICFGISMLCGTAAVYLLTE